MVMHEQCNVSMEIKLNIELENFNLEKEILEFLRKKNQL